MYSVRLRVALSKITQDSDQWIKPQSISYSPSSPVSMDVMPTAPPSSMFTSYGLKVYLLVLQDGAYTMLQNIIYQIDPYVKLFSISLSFQERCAAAETISLVARVLNRSRAHLHSVLSQSNTSILEEFFGTMVNSNLEVLHNLIFFL